MRVMSFREKQRWAAFPEEGNCSTCHRSLGRRDEPTDEEIYEMTGVRVAKNRRDEPTDEEIYEMTGVRVAGSASVTWTKLKSGEWGIRSTSELRTGGSVTVSRRDGTKSDVTVDRKIWSGDGVWLYSIRKAAPSRETSPSHSRSRHRDQYDRYYCTECGDRVEAGSTCWETGLIH